MEAPVASGGTEEASNAEERELEAEFLLQFEKDVALSATRQLALREGARLRTEGAMEARAREVMGQMQAEHERLRMQLQTIRAVSGHDMPAQGAYGDDSTGEGESQQEGPGGWSAAEMQQQCADTVDLDRMYEELVVADIADEEWWEPAESRPSSGVSDPQPASPPGQSTEPEPNPKPEPSPAPAHDAGDSSSLTTPGEGDPAERGRGSLPMKEAGRDEGGVGAVKNRCPKPKSVYSAAAAAYGAPTTRRRTKPKPKLKPKHRLEPEPEPEPAMGVSVKQRPRSGSQRGGRGGGSSGARGGARLLQPVDVGAYAARVAAAKARSLELREAVELGQRQTVAKQPTGRRGGGGASNEQAELARQAWLEGKKKQAAEQRRRERARLAEQEEWEAARRAKHEEARASSSSSSSSSSLRRRGGGSGAPGSSGTGRLRPRSAAAAATKAWPGRGLMGADHGDQPASEGVGVVPAVDHSPAATLMSRSMPDLDGGSGTLRAGGGGGGGGGGAAAAPRDRLRQRRKERKHGAAAAAAIAVSQPQGAAQRQARSQRRPVRVGSAGTRRARTMAAKAEVEAATHRRQANVVIDDQFGDLIMGLREMLEMSHELMQEQSPSKPGEA
jgi:hypothetical protein